jgi:hypothetical protein
MNNNYVNRPFQSPADPSGAAGTPAEESGVGVLPERIVDALEATIVNFGRLIENRSSEELQQAAQDGGWGVVEILAHLQDWEEVTHERVRSILEEEHPELEDYDDTLWAIEHDYGSQDGHTVFSHISDLRQDLVDRLRDLDDGTWQRTASLSGHGEITLAWLMEWLVSHDTRHLGQARDVFG